MRYTKSTAEILARNTILKGRVDLEPMRALTIMLQTSDLELQSVNGSIVIDLP